MRTTLKNGLYLFGFLLMASLLASCLGNNTHEDTYPLTDAELLSFSLSSDSVPALASVVFSIDQKHGGTGLIYNYDSMAYQTKIKDKVIVTYTSGAGSGNVLNITKGDSIWVKSGDSIDISQPLTFKVFALDGKTEKRYNMQLNIHQVDPDSMQYHRIASGLTFLQTDDTKTVVFNDKFLAYSRINNQIQLYTSQDVETWMEETAASGLPANTVIKGIQSAGNRLFAFTEDGELYVRSNLTADQWDLVNKPASVKIKSILGYLNAGQNQTEGLCMVVETGGINVFAFTSDLLQWDYDSAASVPSDFPISDFSSCSYQQMYLQRVSIFGGVSSDGTVQNAVWSTADGRYWAKLTGNTSVFPPLKGANAFYYNNEFWLINGIKTDNSYNRDIYYSVDGGVTWQVKAGKYKMPASYTPRSYASVVMDKSNKYFYIIGGKQNAAIPDVWKGFLNKMEFDH